MKKKTLAPASYLLERLFKRPQSPLSEGYFLCQLNQVWEDLAGEQISKHSQPIGYKYGQLTLIVSTAGHAHEFQFIKETLRKKINERFPHKKVKRIFFQVKTQKPLHWKSLEGML